MLHDLRYALRTMAANPLFAAMAVLSLALGIGANTAIYSFMDAILVRALPVADPGSLIVLQWQHLPRPAHRLHQPELPLRRIRDAAGRASPVLIGVRLQQRWPPERAGP